MRFGFGLVLNLLLCTTGQDGALETMCVMADQLQGAATEPSGDMGVRSGVRPGADPAGWGPPVPAPQQPETPVHQPEGDQPETSNVTVSLLEEHQDIFARLLGDIRHEEERAV